MRKIGVILARLQPVHNGHLTLIEKSINENEETYVFVGSANKFNKGFGWSYAEDSFNLEEYLTFCTTPNKTSSKAVIQFTKDTHEFIRQWDTATEAVASCNTKANLITSCCRGAQKSAGGYFWTYEKL